MSPINLASVKEALQPDIPFGLPLLIRPEMPMDWDKAVEYQRVTVKEAIEKARDVEPRFAVFSLAPIRLVAHLGFLLSDRVEVRPFQYQRDFSTWRWPEKPEETGTVKVNGLLANRVPDSGEAIIRVSLSAQVDPSDSIAVVKGAAVEIDVFVDNPDLLWLRAPQQLIDFGNAVRSILANLRSYFPKCQRIHVFYAGPTGGAIAT